MPSAITTLADRKALLVTRAQLDRTRISLALYDIKAIIRPGTDAARRAALRPTAAMIVGFATPLLGLPRLTRWLRFGSLALAAFRVLRSWRQGS
jgi:hypothetical protein